MGVAAAAATAAAAGVATVAVVLLPLGRESISIGNNERMGKGSKQWNLRLDWNCNFK